METSVLFVCMGNICRSPMAEAVMRDRVRALGLSDRIRVDSCGTGDWHVGSPAHPGTRRILARKGVSAEGLQAKIKGAREIMDFDHIVAMDRANVAALRRLGVPAERIRLLSDFIPGKEGAEVPDPYHRGNFDQVYELVTEGVEGLLREITKG